MTPLTPDDLLTPEAIEAKKRKAVLGEIIRRGTPRYRPPRTGIHFCGFDDDEARADRFGGPHVTEWKVTASEAVARPLFASIKNELGEEDGDLIVDLFIDGSTEDDFWLRRQMFDRARAVIEAAIAEARKPK